jgi:hypothetical protein
MKPRSEGTTLNGFLDKGSHFKGELTFEETFRIDGRFEGKIRSGSELILGDSADVSAEIHVGSLSVNGKLQGGGPRDGTDRAARPRARARDDLRADPEDRGGRLLPGLVSDV